MLYWSGILTVILVNMIEAKHELWVGAVFDYLAMGRRVRDKREALELTQSQRPRRSAFPHPSSGT